MRSWPHWYPGRPLTAQDLLGLEDYLLARSSVCDQGYGIVDFDFYSIALRPSVGRTFLISVSSLKGITPGGQPVIVGTDSNSLGVTTELRIDEGTKLDLSIRVDAGSAADAVPPGAERARLSLQCRPATGSRPALDECELDLGGYCWSNAPVAPELWRRPAVYSLTALKPVDVAWQAWIKPLRLAIRDCNNELSSPVGTQAVVSGSRLAALTDIARLSVSFEYLPISELVFRIKLLRALVSSESRDEDGISDLSTSSGATQGDDLPASLADLLRTVEPEQITIGTRLRENDDFITLSSADEVTLQFKREFTPGVIELRARGATGDNVIALNRNESFSYHRPTRATGAAVYRIPIPDGVFYDARFTIRPIPTGTKNLELYFVGA